MPPSRPTLALALALSLLAGVAQALPPLRDNAHVTQRLVGARIGDVIRRTCPSIHPRIITFMIETNRLKSYVLSLGYTEAEIEAFIEDKAEQARIKALAAAYMKANGVVEGDVESYSRMGRAEIARSSITGSMRYER
jgi:hypothetical protein